MPRRSPLTCNGHNHDEAPSRPCSMIRESPPRCAICSRRAAARTSPTTTSSRGYASTSRRWRRALAMPQWAQSLQAGGAATTGTLGGSLWLWIGLPLISVAAISALVLITSSNDVPVVPATQVQAPVQPVQAVAPETAAASKAEAPARDRAEAVQRNRAVRRARPAASTRAGARCRGAVGKRRSADRPRGARIGHARPPAEGRRRRRRSRRPRQVATFATKAEPTPRPVAEPKEEEVAAQAPTRPEPTPKPPVDEARLEREMGMLAMTQRVLFTDPGRALNLARQGESEFEGSMFTQERQQLLLLALVKLGRLDEAKRLARPTSHAIRTVRSATACGARSPPGGSIAEPPWPSQAAAGTRDRDESRFAAAPLRRDRRMGSRVSPRLDLVAAAGKRTAAGSEHGSAGWPAQRLNPSCPRVRAPWPKTWPRRSAPRVKCVSAPPRCASSSPTSRAPSASLRSCAPVSSTISRLRSTPATSCMTRVDCPLASPRCARSRAT